MQKKKEKIYGNCKKCYTDKKKTKWSYLLLGFIKKGDNLQQSTQDNEEQRKKAVEVYFFRKSLMYFLNGI